MGKFYLAAAEELCLYARQTAFFHSVVKDDKKEPRLSRGEEIRAKGGTPLLPDVGEFEYLVGYWQLVGLAGAGYAGPTAIMPSVVESWQRGTLVPLSAWEFQTLLDMSRAYVSQFYESSDPECPPPFGDPVNEFDRAMVSKKIKSAFTSFLRAKNG